MMKLILLAVALIAVAPQTFAQQRADYDVKRVQVSMIETPKYQFTGTDLPFRQEKWLQIEVDFEARPEFTDELVLSYYVLFNKRLFVGQVTHVNVGKGMDLHSVMYISPKMITRITAGKPMSSAMIDNASVQITKPGIAQPLAEKSFKAAQPNWWATMKQEPGFLVNKSDTPFAPLYWDRYEAIKPAKP